MSSEGKGAINMKFKEPRPLKSSHQLLRLSGGYVKQIPRYTVLHLQSFAHSFVLYIVASRMAGTLQQQPSLPATPIKQAHVIWKYTGRIAAGRQWQSRFVRNKLVPQLLCLLSYATLRTTSRSSPA